MYYEVSIIPASGGFGEWQTQPINGEGWADYSDLEMEMRTAGELYELGVDELPDGVQDIRGRIHNEPSHVFAIVDGDCVSYTGITEVDA